MKNTIAERILDFLKSFPPFDALTYQQLFSIASQVLNRSILSLWLFSRVLWF
ncbi:hypothetical protein [Lacinutrix sp.]|uniref:hypothetical protein n=1 Tax=Lacinutrix sp. TaxID=1937692 RepID=UPI00260D1A41|nr:hypothetical protein [Lacinutrix sp.]MDG1714883.1 hypothetical protein [Lacinutrix sp.]